MLVGCVSVYILPRDIYIFDIIIVSDLCIYGQTSYWSAGTKTLSGTTLSKLSNDMIKYII